MSQVRITRRTAKDYKAKGATAEIFSSAQEPAWISASASQVPLSATFRWPTTPLAESNRSPLTSSQLRCHSVPFRANLLYSTSVILRVNFTSVAMTSNSLEDGLGEAGSTPATSTILMDLQSVTSRARRKSPEVKGANSAKVDRRLFCYLTKGNFKRPPRYGRTHRTR